jgi:hypothetical protein
MRVYRFNAVLLNEFVKDVPGAIAGIEEIVCTMTGDLKKAFAELIGVGKKDRYRYRASESHAGPSHYG